MSLMWIATKEGCPSSTKEGILTEIGDARSMMLLDALALKENRMHGATPNSASGNILTTEVVETGRGALRRSSARLS